MATTIASERRLSAEELRRICSPYLTEGRKSEQWEIVEVTVAERSLHARIRMRSTYISATDAAGFHLTIFSALEFLSQLTIIYACVWAGYEEKLQEAWMIESAIRVRDAIRDAHDIRVDMDVAAIRKVGDRMLAVTDSRIRGGSGGLFEARLKGFMA